MWQQLSQLVSQKWGQQVQFVHSEKVMPTLVVSVELLFEVAQFCKTRNYKVLQLVSGTDYPEKNVIEVCYLLATFDSTHLLSDDLMIKVICERNNPQVPSLCSLWPAANFQERECYDLLGVQFTTHPDLRRILTSDDWEGHPLRKDYVPAHMWRGMVINPPAKMNLEDREFVKIQRKDPTVERPRW